VRKEISRSIGIRTNNQAEYEALLCALSESHGLTGRPVVIRTDSELIYYQMAGRYKVKNARLKPLHAQAASLLSRLPLVRLELVRREENRETDKLAKAAASATDERHGHVRT
jgi:ribonuclease HI